MKKSIAKKWVDALRSKRYKQARNTLKRVKDHQIESFCALGVLCDLYQKEHPNNPLNEESTSEESKNGNVVEIGGTSTQLPRAVQKWAGMADKDGHFPTGETIPELNDRGVSFVKIADLIERNQENM